MAKMTIAEFARRRELPYILVREAKWQFDPEGTWSKRRVYEEIEIEHGVIETLRKKNWMLMEKIRMNEQMMLRAKSDPTEKQGRRRDGNED